MKIKNQVIIICFAILLNFPSQLGAIGNLTFSPIQTGKTSIGVRLNEQSWFKGAISQIRVSPEALNPNDFLNYEIE
ncbi:MAG: hypothetical protein Q8R96_14515 [Bacteroidota bacterium]|nr:hypothetical protein [Bacteroidota bacterium]